MSSNAVQVSPNVKSDCMQGCTVTKLNLGGGGKFRQLGIPNRIGPPDSKSNDQFGWQIKSNLKSDDKIECRMKIDAKFLI